MNPKNDNEKEIEGALEGGSESASEYVDLYDIARNAEAYEAEEATVLPESDDNGMVDLFALAADNDVPPAPAVEDIFVIQGDDTDEGIYPEGFEETEEAFYTNMAEDDEVFNESDDGDDEVFNESDDGDEDYDQSDDEDDEYDQSDDGDDEYDQSDDGDDEYDQSDDGDDEYDEYDDEDDEYDEYDEYDDEDDEYDQSDDEDDEYDEYDDEDDEYDQSDDEDDEYDEYDDEDDEYDQSDDEDDEYDQSDDEDDEYDQSDDEDDEYDESDHEEDDYDESDDEGDDYDESDDEGDDYDQSDDEDDEYDESDDEDDEYDESDDEDDDYDESDDEIDFIGELPDGSRFDEIDVNEFVMAPEEESVDLFEMANSADDLPETQSHSSFYYWAKRKTVSGWVKFALKCTAALLLILAASGVLYFNGLLNLIDYKAADDFEQYDNLSDTDYRDDEDVVYSSPVYYNESTTIEGFNESMIDIPKKDVLNILLIGTDVRGGTYEERGNTDSMILVSVNTRDKNIKLTSFMRDMYVDIPDRDWARLNVAYAYGGPQLLFDTLKKNFDVDVDLYIRVNFANFRKIVNHVGGVDIELTEAEAKYMNDTSEKYNTKPVEPGLQHLDGAQALSYARCRKIDSDFNRTKRQRTVILALVKEIKHCSPGELNSLLNVFLPMIQTNMSKMQILGLMADGTRYLNNNIETLNIPIKNSWRSETIRKRSVICPNFELNKTAIVAHIYSTYRLDVENTKYQSFQISN